MNPRRKILIGLLSIDTIIAIAVAISGGVLALNGWLLLNALVIIPALLIWRRLKKGSRKSGSITRIYHTKQERQYGSEQTTERGEKVRSYGEKLVADYFFKSNIRYEYEEPAWSRRGRRISRPDFYLPDFDVYVEYWGMADVDDTDKKEQYIKSMKWKMAKYRQNGIKFVSIYRDNLNDLDWIFKAKFRDETGIDLNKK